MPSGTMVGNAMAARATEETKERQICCSKQREEKSLIFSLSPDLQSLICISYQLNLSQWQSARESEKWRSLQHVEGQGIYLKTKQTNDWRKARIFKQYVSHGLNQKA